MHKIDSNSCEQEPIRFSGAVMPYGVLVVLRSIEVPVIEAVSDNSEALLGLVAEPLLGHGFAEFFGALAQTALLAAAQDPIRPIIPLSLQGRHLQARTSINLTGQLLVDIELAERAAAITGRLGDRYWRQICALRQLTFLPAIARQATQFFRDITGFERVMLYRFDADWNGEVIADAKVDGLPSYLGLNYPASDIPRQARELFQACRLRLIADVDYQPAALVSAGQPHAIDLGQSTLRSVSPMHLDYLRAMGVAATLVGALVVEDRLWGLISCQARTPHALGPAQRVMLEGLCQDIAAVIEVSQIKQKRQEEVRLAARRRQLVATIRANNLSSLMDSVEVADLLDVVGADGFALLDGKYVKAVGDTPAIPRIRLLRQRQEEKFGDAALFVATSLCRQLDLPMDHDGVAGALVVSVPQNPGVAMIWFRNERQQTVRWAGNPDQAHGTDADGRRSPRRSFAQFLQQIRGSCLPWSPAEIESATELGAMIDIELLRKREGFSQTILDSIADHLAVLNEDGVIVAVNKAWERFAAVHAPQGSMVGLTHREALGGCDTLARGVDDVITKRAASFIFDYPCAGAEGQLWFRVKTYPMLAPFRGAVVTRVDLTARKQIDQQLADRTAHLQALLQNLPDAVWLKDADGRYLMSNPVAQRYFALDEAEFVGKTDYDLWDPEVARSFSATDQVVLAEGQRCVSEQWMYHRLENRRMLLEKIKTPMFDAAGNKIGVLGIARDVTLRKEVEMELRGQQYLLAESQRVAHVGSWQMSLTGSLVWSDETYRICGVSRTDFKPNRERFLALVHPEDRLKMGHWMAAVRAGDRQPGLEFRIFSPDGSIRVLVGYGALQPETADQPCHVIGTVQDITQRKRMEDDLRQSVQRFRDLSRTDPLTGLANRRDLIEAMSSEFRRGRRFGAQASLLLIDVDHFKRINDSRGHEVGDQALVQLAQTLMPLARGTDRVARYGGEEFVFLLVDADLEGARVTAERIRATIAAMVVASPEGDLGLTASIGVASFAKGDSDWSDAMRRADQALYRAKHLGRNRVASSADLDPPSA